MNIRSGFLLFLFSANLFAAIEKPKLIIVISIDQFRADYLRRFQGSFLPAKSGNKVGGFNYLMQNGAYFSHAEYEILQNMTCPGHATILTGSYPYQNGISNNDWFDPETQEFTYCAEDRAHKTLGATPKNPHVGTSPKNLIGSTFGDELKNAFSESRVVSLALKDRSAIMLGGKRPDIALWFDAETFQWITSTYYVATLPTWVESLNKDLKKKMGEPLEWLSITKLPNKNLLDTEAKYIKEMGAAFPHASKFGSVATLLFPVGIDLPIDLAKGAIREYQLGKRKATDLLAMSFSSHDYVGHNFGSESEELRQYTILEDEKFAEFFNHVNAAVGLQNVWIVLTADHGVTPTSRVATSRQIPAGDIDQGPMVKVLEDHLTKKYGSPAGGRWLLDPSELNFFLHRKSLAAKGLDVSAIQDELVAVIKQHPEVLTGIAHVFSGADVKRRTLPQGLHEKQILKTYFEGRSGDVMMIPKPYYAVTFGTATHMSGYAYDRYVPMVFAGKPFKPGLYPGGHVVDIAPTLAFLMGIIPPTSSEGKILGEVIRP